MVLERPLVAPGHEQDVVQPGRDGLLDDVLDRRLVDDRQHLLGRGLGRGQEPRAEARRRDHGLASRSWPHPMARVFPGGSRRAGPRGFVARSAKFTGPSSSPRTWPVTMGAVETSELDRVHAKRELRARLLSARAELTPEQLSADGRSLADQVLALPDVGCRSHRRAVRLRRQRAAHRAPARRAPQPRGQRPAPGAAPRRRPRLGAGPGRRLAGAPAASASRSRPVLGSDAAPWPRLQVVLVPALAVTPEGTRLGRGGGSYDRALPRVPEGVPVLALLHGTDEVLPAGVDRRRGPRRTGHRMGRRHLS